MNDLKEHRRDWEELAETDPLWAISSVPEKKHQAWEMDEFLRSGEELVEMALAPAAELGRPAGDGAVLDFGCGVGRAAPALAKRFGSYTGVDVSEGMVTRARELHAGRANCEFFVNEGDLGRFGAGSFDLLFTFTVLQHVPTRELIAGYLREFARVVRPDGLMVVQLTSGIPALYRIGVRRWGYRALRGVGVSAERAHRLGMHPMRMSFVPREEMIDLFTALGCEVLRADTETKAGGVESTIYYVAGRPEVAA
jgi:SAM-dependent methyltransferase